MWNSLTNTFSFSFLFFIHKILPLIKQSYTVNKFSVYIQLWKFHWKNIKGGLLNGTTSVSNINNENGNNETGKNSKFNLSESTNNKIPLINQKVRPRLPCLTSNNTEYKNQFSITQMQNENDEITSHVFSHKNVPKFEKETKWKWKIKSKEKMNFMCILVCVPGTTWSN